MTLKIVSFLSVVLVLIGSCASTGKIKGRTIDCSKKLNDAIALFNENKFSKVKVRLEEMKIQCNGSTVMDTVLYYLGMTNIHLKKFIEARTEMEVLVQDFPKSVYADEARFRIPYCVFRQSNSFDRDQKETEESVRLFRNLLETGSDGPMMDSTRHYYKEAVEKLAKKEFATAQFYEKLEKYEAAIVYYKTFINEYPQSQYADPAQFSMAELLVKLQRGDEAREILDEMIEQNRDPELVGKIKTLFDNTEKKK